MIPPLNAETNISMTVPQAWGIIVAICGVFGLVIIFLVKIVLKFWQKRLQKIEDGHELLIKGQETMEARQDKMTASLERTAEILDRVQKNIDANVTRHEELTKTVANNDIATRDSTHGIRTLLATEFVPKRDFEKLQDRVNGLSQGRRADDN